MRPSTIAWIGLVSGILAWELFCPENEMLSHGFDNFLEQHPMVTWTVTLVTVGHLLNVLPRPVDPFGLVFRWRL